MDESFLLELEIKSLNFQKRSDLAYAVLINAMTFDQNGWIEIEPILSGSDSSIPDKARSLLARLQETTLLPDDRLKVPLSLIEASEIVVLAPFVQSFSIIASNGDWLALVTDGATSISCVTRGAQELFLTLLSATRSIEPGDLKIELVEVDDKS